MQLVIRPEPSPSERRAIESALARFLGGPAVTAYESRWRAAGLIVKADTSVPRRSSPRRGLGASRP